MKNFKRLLKKGWLMTASVGISLTLVGGSLAYAESPQKAPTFFIEQDGNASVSSGEIAENVDGYGGSEALRERHEEIDHYVFVLNEGHFKDQGFKVTHTGPMDDYIEVGIMPYADEHAQYLYEQLGEDSIQVVEGSQAVPLMIHEGAATSEPRHSMPVQTSGSNEPVLGPGSERAEVLMSSTPGQSEIGMAEAGLTLAADAQPSKSTSISLTYLISSILIITVTAGVIGLMRKRASRS